MSVSLLAAGLLLTACAGGARPAVTVVDSGSAPSMAGLNGTSVGDVIRRPALRLLDTNGHVFDLRARPPGEVTLLFFGYTHCPDACPTAMADLATARRHLPASERARVQVVFVTEDPSRDSPQVLRAWLDRFDSSFTGLVGGGGRTAAVLRGLKSPATEVGPNHSKLLEHTGSVYAFVGDTVIVYTGGTTPTQYAADLKLLTHT